MHIIFQHRPRLQTHLCCQKKTRNTTLSQLDGEQGKTTDRSLNGLLLPLYRDSPPPPPPKRIFQTPNPASPRVRRPASEEEKYNKALTASKKLASLMSEVETPEFNEMMEALETLQRCWSEGKKAAIIEIVEQQEETLDLTRQLENKEDRKTTQTTA